jgi:hypothetical protein
VTEGPINGNGSFSQKEMLVRIDSKVDSLMQTVAAKHAHYDVEIALLKARADERERNEQQTAEEIEAAKERLGALNTRQNIAAGALAFVIFMAPVLWILVNKLVN